MIIVERLRSAAVTPPPSGTRTATTGTQWLSGFMADAQVDSLVITWLGLDLNELAGSTNLMFFKDAQGTDQDTQLLLQDNGAAGIIFFNAGGFNNPQAALPAGVFDFRLTQTHSGGTVTGTLETRVGAGSWTLYATASQTAAAQNPRDLLIFAGEGGVDPVSLEFDGLTVDADAALALNLDPVTPTLINSGTDLDSNTFTANGTFVAAP